MAGYFDQPEAYLCTYCWRVLFDIIDQLTYEKKLLRLLRLREWERPFLIINISVVLY